MEQYPITIDGEDTGVLHVERQGARTVFTAECAMRPELLRISVYGGNREGYLGLLAPENGKLKLRRELSRDAMRDFPEEIERVERAGMMPEPGPRLPAVHGEEPPPSLPDTPPPSPPPPEADGSLSWYASPDGALVCFDGTENLIALPLGDARIPGGGGGWRKRIEGRDYIVYRTKDGRLVR